MLKELYKFQPKQISEQGIVSEMGRYIVMIKGSDIQEGIAILNMYAPNKGASQYVRQKLIKPKGEICNHSWQTSPFLWK